MKQVISEFTYTLPEPTDEELQEIINEYNLTGEVTPEQLGKKFREILYELYSEVVKNGN